MKQDLLTLQFIFTSSIKDNTMTTKFCMTRDVGGYNGFGLQFSDTNASATIAAATDTTYTVPSNSGMGGYGIQSSSTWLAVFEFTPGASVYVALNTTAQVPVGATFASTHSQLNPAARMVKGGDVIHFISANDSDVSIMLYSIS